MQQYTYTEAAIKSSLVLHRPILSPATADLVRTTDIVFEIRTIVTTKRFDQLSQNCS